MQTFLPRSQTTLRSSPYTLNQCCPRNGGVTAGSFAESYLKTLLKGISNHFKLPWRGNHSWSTWNEITSVKILLKTIIFNCVYVHLCVGICT